MKSFWAALQFLTIIPISKGIKIEKENLAKSTIFSPLVGFLIGGILVLINFSLRRFIPALILNLLLLSVWVGLSGGLHLDGFADTVDGLSGGKNKEEILRIMADSCIGAKGAIALILLLGTKFLFLCQLPFGSRNYALFFAPAAGRWAMFLTAVFFPYAKKEGMGKMFVQNATLKGAIITSLLMILLGFFFFKFSFFYLLLGILLTIFLLGKIFKSRIGGITGDCLGAINEIVEVVTLLIIYLI